MKNLEDTKSMHPLKTKMNIIRLFMMSMIFLGVSSADGTEHPVLQHNFSGETISSLQSKVQELMNLTEAQTLEIVPNQTPLVRMACPYDRAGLPYDDEWDNQSAKMMNYSWSSSNPHQITCTDCNRVYPGNAEYPMAHSDTFHNLKGEPVTIPYYYDANKTAYGLPGQVTTMGRRYYMEAAVDYAKWKWLFPKLQSLAELYHLTNDEQYARRASLILSEYAKNFKDFLLSKDYGHTFASTAGRSMPYGWAETRWDRRLPDEHMTDLLEVVDLVYDSTSLEALETELGLNIRDDLWQAFESGLQRILYSGYNVFFGQHPGAKEYLSLGKVFENADLQHLVYQTYFDLPRFAFASDGSFFEGTGYSAIQMLNTAQIREDDGYSDPASYQEADRIDNLKPWTIREDFYRKTYSARNDIRYPDGKMPIIQDSSPFSSIWTTSGPRASSKNIMKSGYKHVILGAGEGDGQIQVQMGFGENSANHSRQDTMGLQLYAFAHPLVDSFPYHKSKLRKYSSMSVSHNTVIVDHQNQNKNYSDAMPLIYSPTLSGLSLFSADGSGAYLNLATKYKRTLALNTADAKKPYIIDIFQVKGGATHDYMMKGASFFPMTAQSSLSMNSMAGERPLLPAGETWVEPAKQGNSMGSGYGLFFNVKQAQAQNNFTVDFTCDDPWAPGGDFGEGGAHYRNWDPYEFDPTTYADKEDVGLRHHVVGQSNQQLFLAETPALNRHGFYGQGTLPSESWDRLPQMILRSTPSGGTESTFVIIHEPYYESSSITDVQRIDMGDPSILLLQIDYADRQDLFFYSLDGTAVDATYQDVSFSGVAGLVASHQNGSHDAYLIGGKSLIKTGKVNLQNDNAAYTGTVTDSSRTWDNLGSENSFIVDADIDLMEGTALAGQWIILKHHGSYEALDESRIKNYIKRLQRDETMNSFGLSSSNLWHRWYENIETGDDPNNMMLQGGGDCFEIARIEKRNGQTIVHTKEDHGLIIGGGKTEEYFYPCRTFEGITTFTIHNVAATRSTVLAQPAGGTFLDSIEVTLEEPTSGNAIYYALTTPSASPGPSDWTVYSSPLLITESSDLHLRSESTNTLMQATVSTFNYTKIQAPIDPSNATAGLTRKMYHSQNIFDPGSSPQETKTVYEISASNLIHEIANDPGRLNFSGHLRVDRPGIYTFYYLADRDGMLKIGDAEVLKSQPEVIATPVSRVVEVALDQGIYPIQFELYVRQFMSHWDPDIKLEWSGPGLERQQIPILTASEIDNNSTVTFSSDLIAFPSTFDLVTYSNTLAGTAVDGNGDPVAYRKISGPSWLTVAADGALGGLPTQGDIGLNTFEVSASDWLGASDSTIVTMDVLANPSSVSLFTEDAYTLTSAFEDSAFSGSISGFTVDPGTNTFTFSKATGSDWLYVTSAGTLNGTPRSGDIGSNTLTVVVSDGNGGLDSAAITTDVLANPNSLFTQDVYTLTNAFEDLPYSGSIAEFTIDPGSNTFTFSKISGSDWLHVASGGTLSGTPQSSDIGSETFTVAVTNSNGGFDRATLQISVISTSPITYTVNGITDQGTGWDGSGIITWDGTQQVSLTSTTKFIAGDMLHITASSKLMGLSFSGWDLSNLTINSQEPSGYGLKNTSFIGSGVSNTVINAGKYAFRGSSSTLFGGDMTGLTINSINDGFRDADAALDGSTFSGAVINSGGSHSFGWITESTPVFDGAIINFLSSATRTFRDTAVSAFDFSGATVSIKSVELWKSAKGSVPTNWANTVISSDPGCGLFDRSSTTTAFADQILDFAGATLSGDIFAGMDGTDSMVIEFSSVDVSGLTSSPNVSDYANITIFYGASTVFGTFTEQNAIDAGWTLRQVQSGYNQWLTNYPSLHNTDPGHDEEPDGMDNLMEYALGANPTNDDAEFFMPLSEVGDGVMSYIYRRQKPADPSLSYTVFSTTNLLNAPMTNVTIELGVSGVSNGFEHVTNTISTATELQQFMQLKIQKN